MESESFDITNLQKEYDLLLQGFTSIPNDLEEEYFDLKAYLTYCLELKKVLTIDNVKEFGDVLNNVVTVLGNRAHKTIEEAKFKTVNVNDLEAQITPFKTHVSNRVSGFNGFIRSQKPLSDALVSHLKSHVEDKFNLYDKWYKEDKPSRDLKRDMSRLYDRVCQQLEWLDHKLSNNALFISQLDQVVDQMNELMERWPNEKGVKNVVGYLTSKVKDYSELSQSLLKDKQRLKVLQESLERLIKEVIRVIDRLLVIKEEYDVKLFRIYTIKKERFPLLIACLLASGQTTAPISPQSWDFFLEVTRFVPINKLHLLLAAQPISDITIVECRHQIQFAYMKIAEEGEILVTEDQWVKIMGPAKDQLDHDICWAFVTAELVSAVRHISQYDTAKVEYSCRDLVDFVNPSKRSEEKTKSDKKHFCYSHNLRESLEYVKVNGIEREEHRPFEVDCREEVLTRDGYNRGYIGEVVSLTTIKEVLDTLQKHPVGGCIPIFEPDYTSINDLLYCGPTSPISEYKTMHAINFVGAGGEKKGERYLNARSSHGEDFGKDGNFKICFEHLLICLTRGHHMRYLEDPILLPCQFVYPQLLSPEKEEEKRRNETR